MNERYDLNGRKVDERASGRRMSSYEMAYRWIPAVVEAVSAAGADDSALENVAAWREYLSSREVDFDWGAMRAESRETADGRRWLLYRFPEPQRMTEPRYGAVCRDARRRLRYYTLEMSDEGAWMIGCMHRNEHRSLRLVQGAPTAERFIEEAAALLPGAKSRRACRCGR